MFDGPRSGAVPTASATRSGSLVLTTTRRAHLYLGLFECTQVGFDTTEPGGLLVEPLFDLGVPKLQHAAQLLDRWLVVEERADLFEGEAKVTKGKQLVQA